MAEISKETQADIAQLQNAQRQYQMVLRQKQQFDVELVQTDAALAELEKADGKTFKAVGTLLIEAKPADLKKELGEKRIMLTSRIDTLKKQEDKLRSRGEELQKKIESALGGKGAAT